MDNINVPALKITLPHGAYVQSLFDPVQTHAVYGLTNDTIDDMKKQLIALGATKFRIVKGRNFIDRKLNGWLTLCYKKN